MTSPQLGGSSIVPALRYADAHAAVAWLQKALGFEVRALFDGADHTVAHAELTLGTGMIMLGSATNPGPSAQFLVQPDEVGRRSTQSNYVLVPDVAATYASAQEAGAEITMALTEMPYGGKAFACLDPEGHLWSVGEYDPWAQPGS